MQNPFFKHVLLFSIESYATIFYLMNLHLIWFFFLKAMISWMDFALFFETLIYMFLKHIWSIYGPFLNKSLKYIKTLFIYKFFLYLNMTKLDVLSCCLEIQSIQWNIFKQLSIICLFFFYLYLNFIFAIINNKFD